MLLDNEVEINEVKYKIFGQIGEGTCGHVYIVKCPQQKKYALKIIFNYAGNPILQDMIDRQIATQSQFSNCEFIIRIHGHTQRHKKMFILFELGSCSLRNLITINSHVEFKEFLKICRDTSRGLYSIHQQQLIHRDIKPENIICVDRTYKITDFGSLQGGTAGDQFIGTTLYMPPELLNNQKYTQKLDVWSLGVSLFQTYFRIHPFYYLQGEDIQPSAAKQHLHRNIKALLPKFTIQKFLSHIKGKVGVQKIEQIKDIVLVTPRQLIEQFSNFFQYPEQRCGIQIMVCAFQSLADLIDDQKCKKTRVEVNIKQLPSDIKFYVDTLNLFYELSFRYGTRKFKQVQFHLELALWHWNHQNYAGKRYVTYTHYHALRGYKKQKLIIWKEIKTVFFDYWLNLSSNEDLEFFSNLPVLKLRILLCAVRYDMIHSEQEMDLFLKRTSAKIKIEISSLEQLQVYLPILQVRQLRLISEIIANMYFYK